MLTLPVDSNERKNYALFSGCLRYFPAALAGVAKTSKLGNDKHNPGQEMHHARNKSGDHGDCIIRHLIDLEDLIASKKRGESVTEEYILNEVNSLAWRALALSQELHEKFGSPLAPGAKNQNEVSANANDLHIAAEKAHEDIKKIRGEQKAILQDKSDVKAKFKFEVGEAVVHSHNDGPEVTVYGNFYDDNMNTVLLIRDHNGKVFQVDPNFYRLAPITAVDEHGTTYVYTRSSKNKLADKEIK